MQFQAAYFCRIKISFPEVVLLLYCTEINKGGGAAPAVRGQPLFTETRWELFTNIRNEQRLCHEYRAGLEAGCLMTGGGGIRGHEKGV